MADPFARVVVRLMQLTDDGTGGNIKREERLVAPQVQWSIIMGTNRLRLYTTSSIPTGLFRLAERAHSGIMGLNGGALVRLVTLTADGYPNPIGLEAGVMWVGIAGDSASQHGQVALVAGLGPGRSLCQCLTGRTGSGGHSRVDRIRSLAGCLGTSWRPLGLCFWSQHLAGQHRIQFMTHLCRKKHLKRRSKRRPQPPPKRLRAGVCLLLALTCGLSFIAAPRPAAADGQITINVPTLDPGLGDEVVNAYDPSAPAGTGDQIQLLLQSNLNQSLALLLSQANASLQNIGLSDFLGANAAALSLANKDNTVDYASDFSLFTFTYRGELAVAGDILDNASSFQPSISNGKLPADGLALVTNFTLGINLKALHLPQWGPVDPSRLNLYLSYNGPNIDGQLGDSASLSFFSLGAHGQYRLLEGQAFLPSGLLRWGGVLLGTGLNYASQTLSWQGTLTPQQSTIDFQVNSIPLELNTTWSGKAQLTLKAKSFAIPFEVATSIQMLHLLTLYGGAGLDLNFGSASLKADSSFPVKATLSSTNPSAANVTAPNIPSTTVNVDFNSSQGPGFVSARAFGGVQLNLFAVAVYGHLSVATHNLMGLQAGFRIFW